MHVRMHIPTHLGHSNKHKFIKKVAEFYCVSKSILGGTGPIANESTQTQLVSSVR